MLQIKHITKVYSTKNVFTQALNGISFGVNKGEFIALMGPSGCGKSTLLNIIGLLDSPNEGDLFYNGELLSGLKEVQRTLFRRGKIGFVFQNFNLINEFRVYDNIELPLLYLKLSAKERKERVRQVLKDLHIEFAEHYYPSQLSGGQQQRVAVGRAIVARPELVLADEPTGNLDSDNGDAIMKLLLELNRQGTTIIMATHSKEYAEITDRIVHLLDGKVISQAYMNTAKNISSY